jgi:hypothetical protein
LQLKYAAPGSEVNFAPDEQSAIKKAIEEYDIPANQRDRLIARRWD